MEEVLFSMVEEKSDKYLFGLVAAISSKNI